MAFNVITMTRLGQGSIAITNTTRYTVPTFTRTLVKDIAITNTTAAMITVSLYFVQSGGSAGATNIFMSNVAIPPNGLFQWNGSQVLHTGDFIVDVASAVGCTINISGAEAI